MQMRSTFSGSGMMTKSTRVGGQAALFGQPGDAREAAALFVDRAADLDRPLEVDARAADRLGGVDGRGDSRLHVARAAAVDAAVANHAAERIDRPARAGRDDVEVAVQVHVGTRRAAAPRAHDVDPRMSRRVFGAAFRGVVFDLEADTSASRSPISSRAVRVVARQAG